MLEKAKRTLRLTTDAYDDEIDSLIEAARLDLQVAGVKVIEGDALVERAILTYCRANFGAPENYGQLKASFDEQKAQLQMASGYTDWGDGVGEG